MLLHIKNVCNSFGLVFGYRENKASAEVPDVLRIKVAGKRQYPLLFLKLESKD